MNKHSTDNIHRYPSINLMKDLNGKNKIKTHYTEDDYLDSNNKKKMEEEKSGFKNIDKNTHHKRKKIKSKKVDKIKTSNSSKNNVIMKYNDVFRTGKKRKKKDNIFSDNKDSNFEDNNYISHPIECNKGKPFDENNMIFVKSSRYISQKHFFLVKEIDRDYDANDHINKIVNSDRKVYKNLKCKPKKSHNIFNFNEKEKQESNKGIVSDFLDAKHDNKKRKKENNCKNGSPIFRKANNKNFNDNDAYKTKKTSQFYTQSDKNKDKECKLKSSVNLNKKEINRKNIDIKDSINKAKCFRRHTIFITNKNKEVFESIKNDKKI